MGKPDDDLKHYGVLGMKWGRRKRPNPVNDALKSLSKKRFRKDRPNPVNDALKSMVDKRNVKMTKNLEKYHEKNKNNAVYKKLYDMNVKRFEGKTSDPHRKAVSAARRKTTQYKAMVAVGAMVAARTAYQKANTPDNIRKGKNAILAMKGSSVRYADVSKYNNIIDM